jgi:hypothetical protein
LLLHVVVVYYYEQDEANAVTRTTRRTARTKFGVAKLVEREWTAPVLPNRETLGFVP